MEKEKFLSSKNILTITFFMVLLMLLSLGISLWQTPKYKASVRLLVVFNQSNIDTYTASKTVNYITGVLEEVIYSNAFINSIMRNGTVEDNLGYGNENRRKTWKKIVKTNILENKGVIIIETYSEKKSEAIKLAGLISDTLIKEHGKYDSSDNRVELKILDDATSYESWSLLKIIRDTFIGLIAGLLIGLTFIVVFPNHRLFDFKNKYYLNTSEYPINSSLYQNQNHEDYEINNKTIENPNTSSTSHPDNYYYQDNNPWLNGSNYKYNKETNF